MTLNNNVPNVCEEFQYAPPPHMRSRRAVAGLTLGVLCLLLCWVPALNWVLAYFAWNVCSEAESQAKYWRDRKALGAGLVLGLAVTGWWLAFVALFLSLPAMPVVWFFLIVRAGL